MRFIIKGIIAIVMRKVEKIPTKSGKTTKETKIEIVEITPPTKKTQRGLAKASLIVMSLYRTILINI
jgi:hypothetical protein